MVTRAECETTKHLQLLALKISLAFIEWLLTNTSVTGIRTGDTSHPTDTQMILYRASMVLFLYYSKSALYVYLSKIES